MGAAGFALDPRGAFFIHKKKKGEEAGGWGRGRAAFKETAIQSRSVILGVNEQPWRFGGAVWGPDPSGEGGNLISTRCAQEPAAQQLCRWGGPQAPHAMGSPLLS